MRTKKLPTHRRPTHPGAVLEEDIRKDLGLTQQQMADRLGISRVRYAEIAAGKRAVTADTALRLARVFGTSAQVWLNMQSDVDLWDALHGKHAAEIKQLKPMHQAAPKTISA